MTKRRFTPPWSVTDYNNACWIVADANGTKLGHFYYDDRQGMDTVSPSLTRAEAYAMAVNFARLPVLLGR